MMCLLFPVLGFFTFCIAAMFAVVFFPALVALKLYAFYTMGICRSKNRLDGKTVVISGGNSGIGKETAIDLAKRGARVIIACRNLRKAEQAKEEIIRKSQNKNVIVRELNLASFASIRRFSRELHEHESKIDILINNAGVLGTQYSLTDDGLEYQMQSNYFGPFLLTNLLLDLVLKAETSRIVNVCSVGHLLCRELKFTDLNFKRDTFGGKYVLPFRIYCASKLCKVLFSNELAAKLKRNGKKTTTVNCLHPGVVFTDIGKYSAIARFCQWLFMFFIKTPKQGAQTSIFLAVDDEVANVTGKYFSDCHESSVSKLAQDADLADTLWYITEKLVKLRSDERVLEG